VADELAFRAPSRTRCAPGIPARAASETYRLANLRYTRGSESFLVVLDAQRSLYAAQQGMISIRLAKYANGVRLYAALGGGGDERPEAAASPGSPDRAEASPRASAG